MLLFKPRWFKRFESVLMIKLYLPVGEGELNDPGIMTLHKLREYSHSSVDVAEKQVRERRKTASRVRFYKAAKEDELDL